LFLSEIHCVSNSGFKYLLVLQYQENGCILAAISLEKYSATKEILQRKYTFVIPRNQAIDKKIYLGNVFISNDREINFS
jgi:hypothetical protein